jgi:hypothetical protein
VFPSQTLFYNYRDNSWAIFNESYTTYGQFNIITGDTWATIGYIYKTWSRWNVSWDSGYSTLNQPEVIAGNSQGFVLMRIQGTGESESLSIQSFSGSQVNSPDHCLNPGDYITISSCIGTIGTFVNDKVFSITTVTQNSFFLLPSIGSGTYFGGGLITRMYVPFIQTKQFPMAWGDGRKTRIGVQRYLLTTTNSSKIQLLIFLSQNDSSAYNTGLLVPSTHSVNDSLIYSSVLYTCPEGMNLGLSPLDINLNTPTAIQQQQLWHRNNTSLIGDTVQLGFTMTDEQMREVNDFGEPINAFEEIELHGFCCDVSPSQMLV